MSPTYRMATVLGSLITVIASGTVFFHFIEGWGWVDSYFFTVVTLSTVGYGNLVPVTVAGKIGTTIFIITGLGIFALAIQQFGKFAMDKREEQAEWFEAHLGKHDQHSANQDGKPHHKHHKD
jgi:voltage-gated potassium channel